MSRIAVIEKRPALGATTTTSTSAMLAGAAEREQLTDRLRSLRRVLPVLAQEMASARRQAAHLRVDNRRLSEQVRELRTQLEERDARAAR